MSCYCKAFACMAVREGYDSKVINGYMGHHYPITASEEYLLIKQTQGEWGSSYLDL